MISVRVAEFKGIYKITVKGHAGYAPVGSDIVCSAVSALIYTLGSALDKADNDEIVLIQCSYNSGDACFVYKLTNPCSIIAVIEAIFDGLELVRDSYPDYISLQTEWFREKDTPERR